MDFQSFKKRLGSNTKYKYKMQVTSQYRGQIAGGVTSLGQEFVFANAASVGSGFARHAVGTFEIVGGAYRV